MMEKHSLLRKVAWIFLSGICLIWAAMFFVKLISHTENLKLIDFAINRPELNIQTMIEFEIDDSARNKWVSVESLETLVKSEDWTVVFIDPYDESEIINNKLIYAVPPFNAEKVVRHYLESHKKLVVISKYQNYYTAILLNELKEANIDISNIYFCDLKRDPFQNKKVGVSLLSSNDVKKMEGDLSNVLFLDPRPQKLKIDFQFNETHHIPIDKGIAVPVSELNQRPIIISSFGRFSYRDALALSKRLKALGVTSVRGILVTPDIWKNPFRKVKKIDSRYSELNLE